MKRLAVGCCVGLSALAMVSAASAETTMLGGGRT